MRINNHVTAQSVAKQSDRLFELAGQKVRRIEQSWDPAKGTPVFTVKGKYTTRGWTEWTQGFQYGCAILHFDATGDKKSLEIGWQGTVERMASHVSHIGVHDHGFNNLSTYGNLLRLMNEGRLDEDAGKREFLRLAIKVSGAVQAARWTRTEDGTGFIHSFNGPHSLFIDTIRSVRILMVAHAMGHSLMADHDEKVSLLKRGIEHLQNTSRYGVYFGKGRDAYDLRGRTAHESVFNTNDGKYRCPNSQQGYAPFSTWTRGLAWAVCGYAEELEFLEAYKGRDLNPKLRKTLRDLLLEGAKATSDFYIENSCADGIPMWDTGAPNLHKLPRNYLDRKANPFNDWEPVDSSAAAIAAQGLIRLGNYLSIKGETKKGDYYRQAGLTVASALFKEPYLSTSARHQGLLLHSIYHRPNGWDYTPRGSRIPCGESSMWGDYHGLELGLLIRRQAEGKPYPTFFGCLD